MPAERTIMRHVREVLRLKFVGGVPIREIARRIGVAASTVRATLARFQAAGLSWPLPGVPRLIVPDNAKVAVVKACLYEPQINRTYAEMAAHYGTAVLPARPYRPRDKTSVSYCTSFGLSRGDPIQPCWTRAAPTMALDDLQAWRDVPKPPSKAV